jgi:lysophospholipase L1-like esterase
MDEQQRFPYLVGRQLEKALNKKVNTYNGGVSANESMHSLNILMNKALPLQPTMVVFMHNINDLVILRSQTTYWYTDSLKSHVQTAKNIFTRYEFPSNQKIYDETKISEEFKRNLRTFIAICRIRDIQPILMTQANRVKDDKLYHHFNDIIREVGKKEDVLVIDLAKNIPPLPENFYDSYHYNAKGAQLASDIITKELEKKLKDYS